MLVAVSSCACGGNHPAKTAERTPLTGATPAPIPASASASPGGASPGTSATTPTPSGSGKAAAAKSPGASPAPGHGPSANTPASGSSSSGPGAAGPAGGHPGNGPAPGSTSAPSVQRSPIPIVVPTAPPLNGNPSSFAAEVVLSGVVGPASASGFVTTTAACPAGTVALGGGLKTTPPPDSGQPSPLHIDGSFPSDANGHPVADGASSAYWTAIVEEGADVNSATGQTTTYVYALCGSGGGSLATVVRVTDQPGPFLA
ncbi:MAG TPA: hypothetical protein VKY26_06675, partial [Actinomycetota bacterium]|nr:hypothetical protein [Actinomycetota bacterium]